MKRQFLGFKRYFSLFYLKIFKENFVFFRNLKDTLVFQNFKQKSFYETYFLGFKGYFSLNKTLVFRIKKTKNTYNSFHFSSNLTPKTEYKLLRISSFYIFQALFKCIRKIEREQNKKELQKNNNNNKEQ